MCGERVTGRKCVRVSQCVQLFTVCMCYWYRACIVCLCYMMSELYYQSGSYINCTLRVRKFETVRNYLTTVWRLSMSEWLWFAESFVFIMRLFILDFSITSTILSLIDPFEINNNKENISENKLFLCCIFFSKTRNIPFMFRPCIMNLAVELEKIHYLHCWHWLSDGKKIKLSHVFISEKHTNELPS